jgi:hypothetical protein
MLRNEKDGRRGVHRAVPRRFLPALLLLVLLIPVQTVGASVQYTSGTVTVGNSLEYGTTQYIIDYAYPSTAQVGTNLSISVRLHVGNLTGLVEYTAEQRLIVNVFISGEAAPLNGSLISPPDAEFLYPGSTWEPGNVTIPLTVSDTGLAKGAFVNASVSVTLQDEIWYGNPLYFTATEPAMQGQAGSLIIQNQVPSGNGSTTNRGAVQTYLPYALLSSGVVLMLLAVVLPRGSRPAPVDQK